MRIRNYLAGALVLLFLCIPAASHAATREELQVQLISLTEQLIAQYRGQGVVLGASTSIDDYIQNLQKRLQAIANTVPQSGPYTGPTGVYKMYLNGSQSETKGITEAEARDNCSLNAKNNPKAVIKCTWEGKELVPTVIGSTSTISSNPSCTISADPASAVLGNKVKVSWTSENAVKLQWAKATSGKDNLKVPSGKPKLAGSKSLKMNVLGNPSLTMKATGSDKSTATCKLTIPVSTTAGSAAFDNTVFTQAHTSRPTISGTANGVSKVGVVLTKDGDKSYGSGLIPVVNGHWSVTVSSALKSGKYFVYVYDEDQNELLNGGDLVVD